MTSMKSIGSRKSEPRIIAFIPARGGSKAIPMKNIANLGGRPLIYWALRACSESRLLEGVFVATDSEVIGRCVRELGLPRVAVVSRSHKSAVDEASTEIALLEFAESHSFDYVVLVQATSPLVTTRDIDSAIELLYSTGADSLLSVVRSKRFVWSEMEGYIRPVNYDPLRRPMRQHWSGQLVENGALYITSRNQLISSACRVSGKIAAYEMPEATSLEIDSPADLKRAEPLLREMRLNDEGLARGLCALKLLCLDVDGTLTDGGMYYSAEGEVVKKFQTRDALGMSRVQAGGVTVALLSGEHSVIIMKRAQKLGIGEIHLGVQDKEALLESILKKHGLEWNQVGFVGDDLNDLGAMRRSAFSACPADAAPEVIREATYLCVRPGGGGAVREICDLILSARSSAVELS